MTRSEPRSSKKGGNLKGEGEGNKNRNRGIGPGRFSCLSQGRGGKEFTRVHGKGEVQTNPKQRSLAKSPDMRTKSSQIGERKKEGVGKKSIYKSGGAVPFLKRGTQAGFFLEKNMAQIRKEERANQGNRTKGGRPRPKCINSLTELGGDDTLTGGGETKMEGNCIGNFSQLWC